MEEDRQLTIPGTEFDEWDQQIDETDAEYALRMEAARIESELLERDPVRQAVAKGIDVFTCVCGRCTVIVDMPPNAEGLKMCPHCGASGNELLGLPTVKLTDVWNPPDENPLADMRSAIEHYVARSTAEMRGEVPPLPTLNELLDERGLPPVKILEGLPDNTIAIVAEQGPGKEPVTAVIEFGENFPEPTPNPEAKPPTVTLCDVPTTAQTIEALEEMARVALAKIEQEKSAKRQAQARAEANAHYEQESIVEENRDCIEEGGTGADCMMCTGEACRYDGFGCWDPELLNCLHDADERHTWDPEKKDARKAEMQADLAKLAISEERRQEMLDKIFAGKPSRPNVSFCTECKLEIRPGEMAYVTSAGSRHTRDCGTSEEPAG